MEVLSEPVIFLLLSVRFSTTTHLLAFNDSKREGFSSVSTWSIRAIGQDLKTTRESHSGYFFKVLFYSFYFDKHVSHIINPTIIGY